MLMALLFIVFSAEAKVRSSGASQMGGFVSCVQESVLGSSTGPCAGKEESPACIGLRRALEFSAKKTDCVIKRGNGCEEWGHKDRAQAEWASIAAAHLAKFGICVKEKYGSEESSGLKEALADDSLLSFLQQLDDGSGVYRFQKSHILVRALHGDRFGYVLQKSPVAKDYTPHYYHKITDGADTPAPLKNAFQTTAEGEESNPSSEGETFAEAARNFLEDSPKGSLFVAAHQATVRNLATPEPKKIAPVVRNSRERNPYSLGLDESLFQRVSTVYYKKTPELRGLDQFVKEFPPPPPRDISELLSKGGSL